VVGRAKRQGGREDFEVRCKQAAGDKKSKIKGRKPGRKNEGSGTVDARKGYNLCPNLGSV
jgi:hypothetical protein